MTGGGNGGAQCRAMVVAGTHSGCGKTTVALGLMAAFVRRGLRVAPFKVGPDFIDPGHHARITGAPSNNLDGWMADRDYNENCFRRNIRGADIAIVEGVMGLFDGFSGDSEEGSTAQMAKWLNLPVILVVDVGGMARSAAALLQGFEGFDPALRVAGVIFNRVGGRRHMDYLREAMAGRVGMACIGGLPREAAVTIPERHLGLVTDADHPVDAAHAHRLAKMMEAHLDLDALLTIAAPLSSSAPTDFASSRPPDKKFQSTGKTPPSTKKIPPPTESTESTESTQSTHPTDTPPPPATLYPAASIPPHKNPRIGIAKDAAFCFYYPENLALLKAAGADLVFFSPVAGDGPPPDLDGLYFGGGYPELYAGPISENRGLRAAVLSAAHDGMPIYGECGGFMYLCRQLTDLEGRVFPMAGCLPFETRMLKRRRALGYREVRTVSDSLLGPAGTVLRGHEFHYSEMIDADPHGATTSGAATSNDAPENNNSPMDGPAESLHTVYAVSNRKGGAPGREGFRVRRALGSYIHLHWGGRPSAARHFVQACLNYGRERNAN